MGKRIKIGDVFSFDVGTDDFGSGQIVEGGDQLFIVIFEPLFSRSEQPDLNQILQSRILLLGHTTDAQFYHKNWTIIGNKTCEFSDQFHIVKYRKLNYRASFSPNTFDQAFEAYHKLRDWKEYYNELTVSQAELELNK